MPEAVIEAPQKQPETFSSFRGNRGGPAPEPVPAREPEAKTTEPAAGEQPQPAADSAPASEQTKVDKRKADIQKDIDALVRQREELKRELAKHADVPRVTSEPPKDAPKDASEKVAADGTDPKDPEPKALDAKTWTGTWEEYQAAEKAYNRELAAWIARNEWRKADASKAAKAAEEQRADAQNRMTAQFDKDRGNFETAARKWAAENEATDFDDLYEEIRKRPVLTPETGAVTMYGGEDGARVLYHLMTHPEELETIENMPRIIDRLNKLYDLKYTLKGSTSERRPAPEQRKSNAPPAGTRLTGTGGGGGSKEPTTFEAFRAKRFA